MRLIGHPRLYLCHSLFRFFAFIICIHFESKFLTFSSSNNSLISRKIKLVEQKLQISSFQETNRLTVWKFHDFSVTQILRDVNFEISRKTWVIENSWNIHTVRISHDFRNFWIAVLLNWSTQMMKSLLADLWKQSGHKKYPYHCQVPLLEIFCQFYLECTHSTRKSLSKKNLSFKRRLFYLLKSLNRSFPLD